MVLPAAPHAALGAPLCWVGGRPCASVYSAFTALIPLARPACLPPHIPRPTRCLGLFAESLPFPHLLSSPRCRQAPLAWLKASQEGGKGGRGAEGGEGGGAGGGGGAVRRTRRDRGGRERGDEGKRGDREGSMKVGGRQKWGGGGGGEGTTCRGEQTMLVGKRDGRGGQVRDENGDPVVERVGSLGTTSRQWDMLIRTLFHDTNERPIRVCIGVCPAPTAMSPPSPQPCAGEEPRGGAASEGGAQEGPTTALAPAPIHTDTGSNSTNRRLEQEGIGMDRAGTTGGGGEGGGGHREHQGEGMHQGGTGGARGREKRGREGSSRRAKTKKPREDPKGGSPSAFDSMD